MLRVCSSRALLVKHTTRGSALLISKHASSSSTPSPNAPVDLDPAFQALMRDVDIATKAYSRSSRSTPAPKQPPTNAPRELEVLEVIEDNEVAAVEDEWMSYEGSRKERKSAEAAFGSHGIGMSVLPLELENAIERLISDSDKHALHEDAKRLFYEPYSPSSSMGNWSTSYDASYKSRKQAVRHHDRDGTAFASIALPAHYSIIHAVLDQVRWRLGAEWNVDKVIDWGSGVGSGLWAAGHIFQRQSDSSAGDSKKTEDLKLSETSISSYLGIEKRDGLVALGKKLTQDIKHGFKDVTWQRGWTDANAVHPSQGSSTLALSAFFLSSLPTPIAKKHLIKEMWDSGAEVIVLIDHDSNIGFESVVEARDYLISLGKRDAESVDITSNDPRGCHVVAPCPHESHCPLFHPGGSRPLCSFSQRLQRTSFIRKTKDVKAGHEDNSYSYVVVRRGPRPSAPITVISAEAEPAVEEESTEMATGDAPISEDVLRAEAYTWPRLVFPPLKKSGHIILDACAPSGQILRMTIPKSQGKQFYYDARKSSWGDMFPHPPKNKPQVRFDPPSEHQRMQAAARLRAASGRPLSAKEKKYPPGRKLRDRQDPPTSYGRIAKEVEGTRRDKRDNLRSKVVRRDSDMRADEDFRAIRREGRYARDGIYNDEGNNADAI